MIRKVISVALAICMLTTAFIAMNVAGEDLNCIIQAKDNAGDDKEIFFNYETVDFRIDFDVDGEGKDVEFTIYLRDSGGNNIDWQGITTNVDGVYRSWNFSTGFDLWLYWPPDGTYLLDAVLDSTGQLLATEEITVISEKIEIVPDMPVYAPGANVTIIVTVDYDDDVNITILPINETWTNLELTDFMVSVNWVIPTDIETGWQTIYVNRSVDDGFLDWDWINIQRFTFELNADREVGGDWGYYLPGETATGQWLAYAVPTMEQIDIDLLEFNMTYDDAITGDTKWLNTTYNETPFSVLLPELADIVTDIVVTVTANVGNYTNDMNFGIRLHALSTTITLTPDPWWNLYMPGEVIEVDVGAIVWNSPLPGANVDISVIDEEGTPIGLEITNLTTNSIGMASAIITLPNDIEEGNYQVVATVTKLGYMDRASDDFFVVDGWTIDVVTDKTGYVSGETIDVTVEIILNGQVVTEVDYLEYWLEVNGEDQLPISSTENLNFQIDAPENINNGNVVVEVTAYLNDGEVELSADSNVFSIWALQILLGASKMEYNPGDTIEFEVLVRGVSDDFEFQYSIYDADDIPVAVSQNLTLDDDDVATFELEVPDDPSTSYNVRVIADNGQGIVEVEGLQVWLSDTAYLVDFWIKTPPKYTSGAYAPGQTIVVAFEIIPQREDVPDLPAVSALVNIGNLWDVIMWWGDDQVFGEFVSFAEMNGELTITIPENAASGDYILFLQINADGLNTEEVQYLTVDGNASGWDSNVAGLSMANWILLLLLVVVIIMMAIMMLKGMGGAPAAAAAAKEKKEKPPKEKQKAEEYTPKATIDCPSCGTPIEVGTSKRPIEVMCPKCGASQMVK